MPSLRRSRNERCLLGPEPIGGNIVGLVRDILLRNDSVVGLPDGIDTVGLPDKLESSDDGSSDELAPVLAPAPAPEVILVLVPKPITEDTVVLFCLFLLIGMSINERCFGEQSRDDDMIYLFFLLMFFSNNDQL